MSDVHVTACYLKDTKELNLTFCWVEQITAVTLLFAASPLNFHLKQQEKKYPLAPRVHSYLIPLMTIVVVVKGTAEQREREGSDLRTLVGAGHVNFCARRFSLCAVICGKELVSSRCIKGRTEEKREATSLFLPPSQAPLRVTNCLSIFLCENKWQLGTSLETSGDAANCRLYSQAMTSIVMFIWSSVTG